MFRDLTTIINLNKDLISFLFTQPPSLNINENQSKKNSYSKLKQNIFNFDY